MARLAIYRFDDPADPEPADALVAVEPGISASSDAERLQEVRHGTSAGALVPRHGRPSWDAIRFVTIQPANPWERACGHCSPGDFCTDDLITWMEDRSLLAGVACNGVGVARHSAGQGAG